MGQVMRTRPFETSDSSAPIVCIMVCAEKLAVMRSVMLSSMFYLGIGIAVAVGPVSTAIASGRIRELNMGDCARNPPV